MNQHTLYYQARRYTIATEVFDGPLDLLLQLIEKAELDITTIALAKITDQYLSYLSKIEEIYPAEVSAFLVIAAKLIQIKSEALLPKPLFQINTDEEDTAQSLVDQLIAYKQYKTIAKIFAEREQNHLTSYLRIAQIPMSLSNLPLNGYDLHYLALLYLHKIKDEDEIKPPLRSVVSMPTVTIREKIQIIQNVLKKYQEINFFRLIKDITSRIEIVVTFLAVLELMKRDYLFVYQLSLFGDIFIQPGGKWKYELDFECEFGE